MCVIILDFIYGKIKENATVLPFLLLRFSFDGAKFWCSPPEYDHRYVCDLNIWKIEFPFS